ncbi:pheST operon leader peptide PheM [Prodigiosinella confusarubida]
MQTAIFRFFFFFSA